MRPRLRLNWQHALPAAGLLWSCATSPRTAPPSQVRATGNERTTVVPGNRELASQEDDAGASQKRPVAPKSNFISPDQRQRTTVGGDLAIFELTPGEEYEVRLGTAVLFHTVVGYLMEHPRAYPGVIPQILATFASQPPFDEVAVIRWIGYGNLCVTTGFTFVGILTDGRYKLSNLDVCSLQEPEVTATRNGIQLIVPPEPPGMRHGAMNPLIPGDEWIFQNGRLQHVGQTSALLPSQQIAPP